MTPSIVTPPDLVAPLGPVLSSPVTGAGVAAATGADGAGVGSGAGGLGRARDASPRWLVFPGQEIVDAHYPSRAMRRRVEGSALLSCIESVDGRVFACRTMQETPPDEGFGRAAIELAPYFRFSPRRVGGRAVEARLDVPVEFGLRADLGGAAPDDAPSAADPPPR